MPMCLKALCLQEGVRVASAAGRLLHRLAARAQGCICSAAAQPAGQLGSSEVRAPCGCASAKRESARRCITFPRRACDSSACSGACIWAGR